MEVERRGKTQRIVEEIGRVFLLRILPLSERYPLKHSKLERSRLSRWPLVGLEAQLSEYCS